MPPHQLSIEEVIVAAATEFHNARHLTVRFMNLDEERPEIDAGWSAGALFGIHFAMAYPQLAARLNRALFDADSTANVGVDLVATALSSRYFPLTIGSDEDLKAKWEKLRDRGD